MFTGNDFTYSGTATRGSLKLSDVSYYDGDVTVNADLYYDNELCCSTTYSVATGLNATISSASGNLRTLLESVAKFGLSARRYTGFGAQS